MSMDNYGGMMSTEETPNFSTRALYQSYQQSHLVANRRNVLREL